MPFARVGPRVDQLLRIDAGGRRAGDVADVVGAGAARAQAEILDRLDHRDGVLRLDLADLQVGAGGDMGIAAAIALGEVGDAGELPMLEDAVRHPQPAHVGVLGRRHVEQAEIAPAEIVRRLGIFVARGLRLEPCIAVEGVLLALEFFLLGKLAAGFDHAVLRAQMLGVGPARFGCSRRVSRAGDAAGLAHGLVARSIGTPSFGDLQARHEPFKVALLLGVEVAGHQLRLCFLFVQRSGSDTGQTAAIRRLCCKAAKSVPGNSILIYLGNFCSSGRPRCRPGQPIGMRLKFYAADPSGSGDRSRRPRQGCPAEAALAGRSARLRRLEKVAGALSAGTNIRCSTCRCTGFLTIGT